MSELDNSDTCPRPTTHQPQPGRERRVPRRLRAGRNVLHRDAAPARVAKAEAEAARRRQLDDHRRAVPLQPRAGVLSWRKRRA